MFSQKTSRNLSPRFLRFSLLLLCNFGCKGKIKGNKFYSATERKISLFFLESPLRIFIIDCGRLIKERKVEQIVENQLDSTKIGEKA
ncbi:hypothetical protein MKW98_005433 [Papaver atlanticum]|uniref:Secreted protein n=1 Tax=Papaver atlanticum TaxID=357466 RepID=A0AAD4T2Z8_9MAGN|nr:hypothetical protein MKW98_005433 [Papaver atlanticum]